VAALGEEHRIFRLNRRATGVPDEAVHDFSQPLPVERLPSHIDAIIHTAGLVGQSDNSAQLFKRINVDATKELADYAVRAGARHFVFCSTGGIYSPTEQKLSEQSPVFPCDAYTESKLAAEAVVRRFNSEFAVKVLRLFFPYGPAQQERLVPKLIQRITRGQPILLKNTSGQPLITPLYIDDLVEYARRALELSDGFMANVAGREVVSIRVLAEMIGNVLDRDVAFEINETGPRCNWWGDSELISRLTDFSPRVSLEIGLERTIARYVRTRNR
jgi:nucleoside-diphosphate-sugar epimerase